MSATSTDYKSSANNCCSQAMSPSTRSTEGSPSPQSSTTGEAALLAGRPPPKRATPLFDYCSSASWHRCCSVSSGVAAARESMPASGCCALFPGRFRPDPCRGLIPGRTFRRHRNHSPGRCRRLPSGALKVWRRRIIRSISFACWLFFL